jgi:uncharacterized protein (TIGR00251 family)
VTDSAHPGWLAADDNGVHLAVRVVPRARKSEVAGVQEGSLRIRLAAPPVEGAANRALIDFVAQCLGVRRQQVEIESGQHSRHKRLFVEGLRAEEAVRQLSALLEP